MPDICSTCHQPILPGDEAVLVPGRHADTRFCIAAVVRRFVEITNGSRLSGLSPHAPFAIGYNGACKQIEARIRAEFPEVKP
jgi:hypothetical protein